MNKQYEYLTALEEEQLKKSAALRAKMLELQSEVNEIENMKIQFDNELYVLKKANGTLRDKLEEEVTLRMKFEDKINKGFLLNNEATNNHALLEDKYERLLDDSIKTENELKILKLDHKKLEDFKERNFDKVRNYDAEHNRHDLYRLD